jgi:hypothetical protein
VTRVTGIRWWRSLSAQEFYLVDFGRLSDELAAFRTAAERSELDLMLGRHSAAETAEIDAILSRQDATRRYSESLHTAYRG